MALPHLHCSCPGSTHVVLPRNSPPRHKFLSALPRCGFRSQWSAIPFDVVEDSVGRRSAKRNKALGSVLICWVIQSLGIPVKMGIGLHMRNKTKDFLSMEWHKPRLVDDYDSDVCKGDVVNVQGR